MVASDEEDELFPLDLDNVNGAQKKERAIDEESTVAVSTTAASSNQAPVSTTISRASSSSDRSNERKLITHHDPFLNGECFEKWLTAFNHGTLILNVKEEGLESRLIELMNKNCIEKAGSVPLNSTALFLGPSAQCYMDFLQ